MIARRLIRAELSRPSQKRSAYSVRWASSILAKHGVKSVVDFGCGSLRNLPPLERHFESIALVETRLQCGFLQSRLHGKNHVHLLTTSNFSSNTATYDAIFFISVLHTIPSPTYRQRLVSMAVEKLNPNGFVVVDVPQSETYYNRRRDSMLKYSDGFLLSWGSSYSFYKSFYAADLDALFEKTGELVPFEKHRYPKHLIRIWRRTRKITR